MIVVRSTLFFIIFYLWTVILAFIYLPLLLAPRQAVQAAVRLWLRGALVLARVICGLRHRIVGREHITAGAAIIAAKHQSIWETMIFHQLLEDPVYAAKQELFAIPFVGWYMRKAGCIPIDRSSRVRALRTMIKGAVEALAEGRQVVVFPEGTRVPPGAQAPYHAGIAALHDRCVAPILPVALNSGMFWDRRSFYKYPGVITLEFLQPMTPGLERGTFLHELRRRIEDASARLFDDAEKQLKPEWRSPAATSPSKDRTDPGNSPRRGRSSRGPRRKTSHPDWGTRGRPS